MTFLRWAVLVLGLGAALLGAGGCRSGEPPAPEAAQAVPQARAAYVGDEACADCHGDLYQSFHRTGMGRSMSRFDPATAPERFGGKAVYNAAFDFYYEAFVRNDTLYQREYRLDDRGRVVHERVHAADYVIGSGNATRSYLMDVGGYVTEMPLTWYVERGRWDLSPGYEQSNARFGRPITLECMTCHNGLPEHTPATENHYTEVPLGITCERCHGPGSEHVEARLAGFEPAEGAPDPDIVNPARLARPEQLAVCQQCHLSGETVFKPGEDPTTYRPGRPLAAHRSVFVLDEELEDPERFGISSHAARLAQSACFQASDMTCTTCHDPHQPVAELGADHFNAVCASCHTPLDAHEGPVCSRDEAHSAEEAASGNCVSCHLQRSGTSDIPHVLYTDHWIRRRVPPPRAPEKIERILVRTEPFRLVRMEDPGTERRPDGRAEVEEAIAYFKLYETRHRLPAYLPGIVERLRRRADPEDVEARLVLARTLAEQDSLQEALAVLEKTARRHAGEPLVQLWLGKLRLDAGRPAEAVAPLERAVALQPALLAARLSLGEAYSAAGQLAAAEAAFREALRRDSVHHPQAWNNLGFLHLQTNRLDEADRLFARALALDPDLAVAWVNAGTVRLLRQDLTGAAERFEQALRVEPDNVPALGNLGLTYARLGRYAEARALLERVVRLQPGDQRARALLEQLEQLPPS